MDDATSIPASTDPFDGETLLTVFQRADSPRLFFDKALADGTLTGVLPELAELDEMPAGPEEFHAEGSAFEHTMRVLEEMHALRPNDERALLAATFHDVGKVETPPDVLPHHYSHEKRGKHIAADIATRLDMRAEHRDVMRMAARMHGRMHDIEDLRESTLIEMVDQFDVKTSSGTPPITLDELIDLAIADSRGRIPATEFDRDYAERLFDAARTAITEVTVDEVVARTSVDRESPHLDDVVLQERVRRLKEERKSV